MDRLLHDEGVRGGAQGRVPNPERRRLHAGQDCDRAGEALGHQAHQRGAPRGAEGRAGGAGRRRGHLLGGRERGGQGEAGDVGEGRVGQHGRRRGHHDANPGGVHARGRPSGGVRESERDPPAHRLPGSAARSAAERLLALQGAVGARAPRHVRGGGGGAHAAGRDPSGGRAEVRPGRFPPGHSQSAGGAEHCQGHARQPLRLRASRCHIIHGLQLCTLA